MLSIHPVLSLVIALTTAGCAAMSTAPTDEQKNSLAPAGRLRVGFLVTNPMHAVKDAVSGEPRGPAVDLGKELAQRIGVPFEAVPYTSFPPLLAGATSGEWDIATMGISADRQQIVDFTVPYMVVEFSYLVPSGSPATSSADLDRAGVRIAVLAKGTPDLYLSRSIREAALVRFPTLAEAIESLRAGKADAVYGTKAVLAGQSEKLPGSRVLEDRGGEETALAVPKGRGPSSAYAQRFVEDAKSTGLVDAAIKRAQLRGVIVAR